LEERLDRWLSLMDGPGWQGREARDRAVDEMRAAGTTTVLPALTEKLADPDGDTRCRACVAILFADRQRGVELVLPLLNDPEPGVQYYACGCLMDFGDERAVEPLVALLRSDPDPGVRVIAADALGRIGSPVALPALQESAGQDHEVDPLGFTPSSPARQALEAIRSGERRSK
jgi:HEAT repeat protein